VDKDGSSLVSLCFSENKLYLLPFFREIININNDPKILFSLNPLADFENVNNFIKSHDKIED
jgi:hypothetical protein